MALPHRRRSSPIKGGALMFPTSEEITTWMPELLGGLSISLQVTALSLLFGIPLGLVLALGVLVHNKVLRVGSLLLVEIGRGAPALRSRLGSERSKRASLLLPSWPGLGPQGLRRGWTR